MRSSTISGSLVRYSRPAPRGRSWQEGPVNYRLAHHDRGLIHVLGSSTLTVHPTIFVTGQNAQTLGAHLRQVLVPRFMEERAFQRDPGKWLDHIQTRQNRRIINLREIDGWNLAAWNVYRDAVQLRFVGDIDAPGCLASVAKVWARFEWKTGTRIKDVLVGNEAASNTPESYMHEIFFRQCFFPD